MAETNYRTDRGSEPKREHSEGIMDQVSELGERAGTMAGELGAAIKERPYTTLAIAAGLAFAVGALWKLGQQGVSLMIQRAATRVSGSLWVLRTAARRAQPLLCPSVQVAFGIERKPTGKPVERAAAINRIVRQRAA